MLKMIPLLLVLSSCSPATRHPRHADDTPRWAPPPVKRIIAVRDGHTDAPVSFDALIHDLARADVVFLGENHNDETTHRVELAIYDALLAQRRGRVVLAMEMFERDVQPHLNAYIAGRIDEQTFLKEARPWANYRSGYRYLIERAKTDGRPVIGSNFPRPLLRRVSMEGPGVLDNLEGAERDWAPRELYPNTPEYWRRVDNAIRSHRGMFPASADDGRLYSTQTLWDNAMGEACATALEAHPGSMVLHVNGGFHSAYWDGTVHQLKLRRPRVRVKTVAITPVDHPGAAGVDGKPAADYVVFAEARSSDRDQGRWAVRSARDMTYNIHRPNGQATRGPYPMLIWLGDDGLTAEDGLDLWKARLGDDAIIVAFDPPYRAVQPDLSTGGRWYWPDSFSSDLGAAHGAIHGAWSYVIRHFPVDPLRVCIAGEGTGATVVSSVALMTESIEHDGVAIHPRKFARLKDLPLPLPDYRGDDPQPEKSLLVLAAAEDEHWWTAELEEYRGVDLHANLSVLDIDPWSLETTIENAIRSALGLRARPQPTGSTQQLVAAGDTPRARHWARLFAIHETAQGRPTATGDRSAGSAALANTRIEPSRFIETDALPRCPGPFGGTTVVLLEPDSSTDTIDAWRAVEASDPINATSRFHRLKVVSTLDDLNAVLEELLANDRKNVLIIPATFCADIATMQRLRSQVSPFENRMTIHWLPGLGGRLSRLDD